MLRSLVAEVHGGEFVASSNKVEDGYRTATGRASIPFYLLTSEYPIWILARSFREGCGG